MNPISELGDIYVRLFEELPALSRGPSNDNAAGYAAAPDPRRAPLRLEVSDLIADIETWVMEGRTSGEVGEPKWRVREHMLTLRYWYANDLDTAGRDRVREEVGPLLARGRRLLGDTLAPVPLVTPCPECGSRSVFRAETPQGLVAGCSACRGRWDEEEWQDARRSA